MKLRDMTHAISIFQTRVFLLRFGVAAITALGSASAGCASDLKCATPIPFTLVSQDKIDRDILGEIGALRKVNDELIVVADGYLYKYTDEQLKRLIDNSHKKIYNIISSGGITLINSQDGLFIIDKSNEGVYNVDIDKNIEYKITANSIFEQIAPSIFANILSYKLGSNSPDSPILPQNIRDHQHNLEINSFVNTDAGLFIGTRYGLFRVVDKRLVANEDDEHIGRVKNISIVNSRIITASNKGLFVFEQKKWTNILEEYHIDDINDVFTNKKGIYIGSSRGLFHIQRDDLKKIEQFYDNAEIERIVGDDNNVYIISNNEIFRFDGKEMQKIYFRDGNENILSSKYMLGKLFIITESGVHILKGSSFHEIFQNKNDNIATDIINNNDELFISTKKEIFKIVDAKERISPVDKIINSEANTAIAINFYLPECLSTESPYEFHLVEADSLLDLHGTDVNVIRRNNLLEAAAIVKFPSRGTYHVQLMSTDGSGETPVSDSVEVRVSWTYLTWATHHARQIAFSVLFLHSSAFLILLIGSRHSTWCWRLVNDPIWGRLGLWWSFALRHTRALQRWMLARWFEEIRSREWQTYLSQSLSAPNGVVIASDTLLDHLRTVRLIWIQGAPGMGKTTLVDDLARRYFSDSTSLATSYHRYGYILIVVRLRDVLNIKFDSTQPHIWVPELARAAMRAGKLHIEDAGLFRSILESGSFAMLIDGANEISNSFEIEDYFRRTPEIRAIITSQSEPRRPGFEILRLPKTVEDSIEPLLRLFLGEDSGMSVSNSVRSTTLWGELLSGYDVRLLAELASRSGKDLRLPTDRIGLYNALLSRLVLNGSAYPEDELRLAAWRMWRDGVRRFDGQSYLSSVLIEPLLDENARVVRVIEGTLYEFRHDQMRGYLAALWAAHHETTPIRLFEQDNMIWRLDRSEQEVVWSFFSALIDRSSRKAIWSWCHGDPERSILQYALGSNSSLTRVD